MDTDTYPDTEREAAEAVRVEQVEAGMTRDGIATHVKVAEDYFGFDVTHETMLPDTVQWVQHREMNEGQRKSYLNKVNRDVRLQKATGDAFVRMAPGDERAALLEVTICGWNLQKDGQPFPFSERNLKTFLNQAPPRVIDVIEKDVRKANAWLLAEVSIEDIDKEIATLEELRATKVEEEAGKLSS